MSFLLVVTIIQNIDQSIYHLLPYHYINSELKGKGFQYYNLKIGNETKEIDVKNDPYYFFDDMININLDFNKIKIDEKSCKNILVYYIGYVTVKNLSYTKTNSVNLLYLIIDKINGYIEESNRNEHLMLVPTDECKDTLK